jgi:hypothetical protein
VNNTVDHAMEVSGRSQVATLPPQPPKSPWGNKVHTTLGMKAPGGDEELEEIYEQRRQSTDLVKEAAENERSRRIAEENVWQKRELEGRQANIGKAVEMMEGERHRRIQEGLKYDLEAASERTERQEYASRQLHQEHMLKEQERRKGQLRLHEQLSKDIVDFNKKLQR